MKPIAARVVTSNVKLSLSGETGERRLMAHGVIVVTLLFSSQSGGMGCQNAPSKNPRIPAIVARAKCQTLVMRQMDRDGPWDERFCPKVAPSGVRVHRVGGGMQVPVPYPVQGLRYPPGEWSSPCFGHSLASLQGKGLRSLASARTARSLSRL